MSWKNFIEIWCKKDIMKEEDKFFRWKKGESRQLTKSFNTEELSCKCEDDTCVNQVIRKAHVNKLQELRDRVGALKVTSAYRCEAHNKAVGGSKTSRHKHGDATDVVPLEESLERVAALADAIFDGLGKYPGKGFLHLDSRGYKARWEG